MKKILLTLTFASIFILGAQSQIRFGARAGLNVSNVSSNTMAGFLDDDVTGFYVGPAAEWLIAGKFGLEASLLYSEKGIKIRDRSETNRNGFLEIPVNLRYKFPISGSFKPFVDAGPYISFRVSGDDNFTINRDNIDEQWKAQSFGAGFNLGAGIEVLNFLQIRGNYGLGLSDNFKQSDGTYSFKNNTWSVGAAVFF